MRSLLFLVTSLTLATAVTSYFHNLAVSFRAEWGSDKKQNVNINIHGYWHLFENLTIPSVEVINGIPVNEGFEYVCHVKDERTGEGHDCMCVIVEDSIVLLAGHCMVSEAQEDTKHLIIYVGSYNVLDGVQYRVECARWMYGFDNIFTHGRDLGVAHLTKSIKFNDKEHPADKIQVTSCNSQFSGDYTVAGFGKTETGLSSKILLQTTLKSVSHLACAETFTWLTPFHECFRSPTSSLASGDSGTA